jgi:hypothetical protein
MSSATNSFLGNSPYVEIKPIAQKQFYNPNDNIDFVMSLNNQKLIPGTVELEGVLQVFASGTTAPTGYQDIAFDPLAGAHALFRDFTTEMQNLGTVEQINNYPRKVKMVHLALKPQGSLGTETNSGVECIVPTIHIAKGLCEGSDRADTVVNGGKSLPFSIKPLIVLNDASGPIPAAVSGEIRVRTRFPPAQEVLFGEDYVQGTTTYRVLALRLRYQVIEDDGTRPPIQLNSSNSYRATLDSNNQNVSTFVPDGLCTAMHASFISLDDERASNGKTNYLQCAPPPGIPPLGASAQYDTGHYGVEQLYYAINDIDSALVGFTLESREEILGNGLRSYKAPFSKFNTLISKMQDPVHPDGYLAGIPFGGPLDFRSNKFSCEVQTQCSNANVYVMYLYFDIVNTI